MSVYWYCARLMRVAIWMSCAGWKYRITPGMRSDLLLQPLDDGRHRVRRTSRERSVMASRAGIRRRVDRRDADDRDHAGDVGILADRRLDLVLQPLHLGERDLVAAFHHREDQAGVLLRQEALRE